MSVLNDKLAAIIARKRQEVRAMAHPPYSFGAQPQKNGLFYQRLVEVKTQARGIHILEYKRRSPSAGAIAEGMPLQQQLDVYLQAGATAISVLTDSAFGGSPADIAAARKHLGPGVPLLMKDFVVDAKQLHLAKAAGADAILLMASVLSCEELSSLLEQAHTLGLGALVEVHTADEALALQGLPVQVVGVNNRNLRTFRVALNHCHTLRHLLPDGLITIGESGISAAWHYQAVRLGFDGVLIGTGLMQNPELAAALNQPAGWVFKACGLRAAEHFAAPAELHGVNFSPESKRRFAPEYLPMPAPPTAVAVFKGNTLQDVVRTVEQFGFSYAQLYAEDFTPDELQHIPARLIVALRRDGRTDEALLSQAEAYASYADLFILDGCEPGSGQEGSAVPLGFRFPFLLAGGMHQGNLNRIQNHPYCQGVDMASGLETAGQFDPTKARAVRAALTSLPQKFFRHAYRHATVG